MRDHPAPFHDDSQAGAGVLEHARTARSSPGRGGASRRGRAGWRRSWRRRSRTRPRPRPRDEQSREDWPEHADAAAGEAEQRVRFLQPVRADELRDEPGRGRVEERRRDPEHRSGDRELPDRDRIGEERDRDQCLHDRAHHVGADHQLLPRQPVRPHPAAISISILVRTVLRARSRDPSHPPASTPRMSTRPAPLRRRPPIATARRTTAGTIAPETARSSRPPTSSRDHPGVTGCQNRLRLLHRQRPPRLGPWTLAGVTLEP